MVKALAPLGAPLGPPWSGKLALGLALTALLVGFYSPLVQLARFSAHSELYSYIPLIPLVSLYLVWMRRKTWGNDRRTVRGPAVALASAGAGLILFYAVGSRMGLRFVEVDYLSVMTLALLSFLGAILCLTCTSEVIRTIAFPFCFLRWSVPLPVGIYRLLEHFLQDASALVSSGLFQLCFTPVWRDGVLLHLPGTNLEVAPECCGIHSTVVLFILSLLGSFLFLRSATHRILLIAIVLPLALLRNGIRILVVGELCVHIGPEMIDSYIHRHGGPIFFIFSLIPFLYLLQRLRQSELAPRPETSA